MATDPFDSLRVRLTNHVAHRRSLGVLGLLGIANMALPDEITAKKKRKKKKKKGTQATTTLAPATTSTATTRTPGTCGAPRSNCGTEQTPCICGSSATNPDLVRCLSYDITNDECVDDSNCVGGKVCIYDPIGASTAYCMALCSL